MLSNTRVEPSENSAVPFPDWSVIYEVVAAGGVATEDVLKRIHAKHPRNVTFEVFKEKWKSVQVLPALKPPAHTAVVRLCSRENCEYSDRPHCHCPEKKCSLQRPHCHCCWCDNKQSYSKPGRKPAKRFRGAMDISTGK